MTISLPDINNLHYNNKKCVNISHTKNSYIVATITPHSCVPAMTTAKNIRNMKTSHHMRDIK